MVDYTIVDYLSIYEPLLAKQSRPALWTLHANMP